MRIEPATCPACGGSYDPLRARAVTVVDGRVRAFCSPACRDRGPAPAVTPTMPPPSTITDAHAPVTLPRRSFSLPAEYRVLAAAATIALAAFVALILAGRHRPTPRPAPLVIAPTPPPAPAAPARAASEPDIWMQPLAGKRHALSHSRAFGPQRDGVPAAECADGRCAVEVEATAGEIVMAVHDGVIEAIGRDASRPGGRFIRINHSGGTMASTYLALDGIREDLRPGVPVKLGEPIGTVATSPGHAHLGFAVSIRDRPDGPERYINPESLLALWPARKRAPTSLHAMQKAADDDGG